MISVTGVNKSFGAAHVLKDLSFDIRPGLMTGFVGGNGAGKTTTMRILLGVLTPDSGSIDVDGAPITADYRAGIGYMPEERGLYPKMAVLDQLVYLGRLHGMGGAAAKARGLEMLERLGLAERAGSRLEELSLGNQQRAQIAAALVHEPVALVLDEPFSGLDPNAVDTTLQVLRETADTGVPVLFSSHQLDVVERLCDELVILADGRVRAAGTRAQLLAAHAEPEWELVADTDTGWVRGMQGVEVLAFDGGRARFRAVDEAAAQSVLGEAVTRGGVRRFGPVPRTLHEIFTEVTR
ncbi:ATP-binding cassette domain-containing protein [Micrococcus sp. M4NT]|uniref:ABC transporter ATP-binding protein n=1 Tax=Micrococcus sp. M4NT TaxID=2957501 RepID=UPI0029B6C7F0|nr:ATP-binding cassette domain-containing protein [Micrococcus sp. M4NT]MDX2341742.1 ATP-binding cassette domain-containing protein [Micrococcus sp. M4NT]